MRECCTLCASDRRQTAYYGPMRGLKGRVYRCSDCGVEYLSTPQLIDYTKAYREQVGNDGMVRHIRNIVQVATYEHAIRGRVVLDIGCSDGEYLYGIKRYARKVIGVEPNDEQRKALAHEFEVYESLQKAVDVWAGQVDSVTLWHVIEHISDPVGFLMEAAVLLSDRGRIYLSTPNRDDVLMRLLPDDYPEQFYRPWHTHYYDRESLYNLSSYAGLRCLDITCLHSWGLGNTMGWLRDRKPVGNGIKLDEFQPESIDNLWGSWLETVGLADTLYAVLTKENLH